METVKGVVPADNARGKLFYAFLELIEKKPFNKIKVSELIEKANVNRSTFYRYYSDIYDYFDRICTSGLLYSTSGLDKCAENKSIKDGLDAFYSLLSSRIDIFSDIAKKVTGKNGSIAFIKDFRGYLIDRLEEAFVPKTEEDELLIMLYAEKIYVYLLCAVCPPPYISDGDITKYIYSPEKGVIENIVTCISRGNGEVFAKLMTSAASIFLTKEPRALNVNNIARTAFVSRTEFYNFFGNIHKMIDDGIQTAAVICSQVLFEASVCNEDDFFKILPQIDINNIIKSDNAIELARKHPEYYVFISSTYDLLLKMLKNHLCKNGIFPSEDQRKALEFYASWAILTFVICAEDKNPDEFKKKLLWGKNRLTDCGLRL